MKLIASLFLMSLFLFSNAQNNINVTPMPAAVKMGKGVILINPNTQLVLEGSNLEKCAAAINDYLFFNYGIKLTTVKKYASSNSIVLNYERLDNELPGAYNLTVDKKGIYIAGDNEEGVFYGVQTLLQLFEHPDKTAPVVRIAPIAKVPYVAIQDRPRFGYRGMHLDVARHFFPVSYIKKYIDYLATYKFNTFHFHLTDDQGWRIEIKKYPLLTTVGGYRNGTITGRYPGKGNDSIHYGGFYTQEDIKEIVKYAASKYITVIPEIEMPGHASAAIAAYPQLSCFPNESTDIGKTPWAGSREGKQVQQTWGVFEDVFCPSDYTFKFLQDVLDEVTPLFPAKYIHIGGDESPKESWKRSPFCQQLIKEKKLKDEHGLQSYFIQRMEKYINGKGKKIIGWDEILEGGLAPNATVMSWRGEEGGIAAAKQNHDVIMTPGSHCYIDHSQSRNEDSVTIGGYLPLDTVYNYEPVPDELNAQQAKHILGAQGNLWTEYIGSASKVEYMIFPRMIALSEVLWSPKKTRSWKDFERRLPLIFERLQQQKINYSKAYYDLRAAINPTENFEGIQWTLDSKDKNAKIFYQTILPQGKFYTYSTPVLISQNTLLNAWAESGNVKSEIVTQYIKFNKATGKKITLLTPPSKSYPGSGAFTLVDGVQNEKGMSKTNEFLGFLGKDVDAIIDLHNLTDINKITIHALGHAGSWIYLPRQIEITYIPDVDFTETTLKNSPKEVKTIDPLKEESTKTFSIESKQQCRYLKIVIKNFGIIPTGNPGAGTAAWLFVDEIEVE